MSMGPLVDIGFAGADAQRNRFWMEKWAKALGSLEAPFRDTLRVFEGHLSHVFDDENASGVSGTWRPLSPRYRRWKDRFFPGNKILVRTGALRLSLTTMGHPAGIRHADATSLVYGTTLPWGYYHQVGGTTKKGRPPHRPLFDWRADATSRGSVAWAVTQVFQAHVVYQRDLATEGNNPIPPARTVEAMRRRVLT